MIVVHIGLGKTSTSTLQGYVYPKLAELKNIIFNDKKIIKLLEVDRLIGLSDKEILNFNNLIKTYSNILVSSEELVNWNPHFWEMAANRNLELFGKHAKIIITVRDPYEYYQSIYVQKIHEGNIILPDNFFVNSKTYNLLNKFINNKVMKFIDVDSFDIEKLIKLYQSKFKVVYVVPMHGISKMDFLKEIYSLSNIEHDNLINIYKNSSHKNISYKKLSIKLTFLREKFFNIIGATTINSDENMLKKSQNLISGLPEKKNINKIFFAQKLTWRYFMNKIIDKSIGKEKFCLPNNIYLNKILIEKNRVYLNSLGSFKKYVNHKLLI